MPWSITSPWASLNCASVACRGSGSAPTRAAAILLTPGPETRTTPMPPRPAGVATAAMVSRPASALGMGSFVAVEHPLYLPLLEDGKDVVDEPVEHQPGGKEEKEDAEHKRHELHDLCLYRVGRHRIHPGLQHHRHRHEYRQHIVGIERRKILDPQDEGRMA